MAAPVVELCAMSRTGRAVGLGEVPGEQLDGAGQRDADQDGPERDPLRVAAVAQDAEVGDAGELAELVRQVGEAGDRHADHGQDRRDEEPPVDRAHPAAVTGPRPDHEDADDRGDDADGRDEQRDDQAVVAERDLAEDQRGHQHDRVGLEQVGGHARAVAHVVPNVVGDRRGVPRVVFGYALLDLADQVGADVGRLGVDAAADPHEHRQQCRAEAEALEHIGCVGLVDEHHDGRAEQAQADGEHAGHCRRSGTRSASRGCCRPRARPRRPGRCRAPSATCP